MENIINIGTFIQHLTYYLKVAIHINKGTEDENLLEKCIKLYNRYKTIESSKELGEKDEILVRKCLKRLNLILKIDTGGLPVDIQKKENQSKMILFSEHPSLGNNDLQSMLSHADKYHINILTDIPLVFILRESKYQELLWQYTRSLFYISQLLISRVSTETKTNSKMVKRKRKIYDSTIIKLESILTDISEIEEKMEINKALALDNFLKRKLINSGLNKKNVNEASNEVKEMFQKKGLEANNPVMKMIDSISNKLLSSDLSSGNILENMYGIAQNIAQEMRTDPEQDPEKFQETLGTITDIFKDAMSQTDNDEIPPEMKDMMNTLMSSEGVNNQEKLEQLINSTGLSREDFFQTVQGENGEIDVKKLECLFKNK